MGFEENLSYGFKDSRGVVTKFETETDNLIWIKIKDE